MTGEAPKQPAYRDNVDAPPKNDRAVDPRDLVRTEGIPEHPEEVLTNPGFDPQMINEGSENLRSDLKKDE